MKFHLHTPVLGFGRYGDDCICATCGRYFHNSVPFWSSVFGLVIDEDDPRYDYWLAMADRRNIIWRREHGGDE